MRFFLFISIHRPKSIMSSLESRISVYIDNFFLVNYFFKPLLIWKVFVLSRFELYLFKFMIFFWSVSRKRWKIRRQTYSLLAMRIVSSSIIFVYPPIYLPIPSHPILSTHLLLHNFIRLLKFIISLSNYIFWLYYIYSFIIIISMITLFNN